MDFSEPARVRFGSPVTFTATAIATNVEYKFVRRDPSGNWTIVQDWSRNPTFTWTPTYADLGVHDVQVWVRALGSTNVYDDLRGMQLTVDDPLPAITSFTSTPGTIGGTAPYEYQFWRLDAEVGILARTTVPVIRIRGAQA